MARKRKNLIGKRSGKLLVVRESNKPKNSNNSYYWWCLCDCGEEREIDSARLRDGHPNQALACLTCLKTKDGKDLQSLFPEIASEADGWDPSKETAHSGKKKLWKCKLGHPSYENTINDRTREGMPQGCPICSGKKVLKGFNDLKSNYPEIAKDAFGWDPTKFTKCASNRKEWKCSTCGYEWKQTINKRTPPDPRGCPLCANQVVVVGINDLATTHPELANEAHKWDPTTVTYGSMRKIRNWKCPKCEEVYPCRIANRSKGRGCPFCAEYGYNKSEPGWMYLMFRQNEQQIGISNDIEGRLHFHKKKGGWKLLDKIGPFRGDDISDTEKEVKRWLRKRIGTIEGTTENWYSKKLRVKDLKDLFSKVGISPILRSF